MHGPLNVRFFRSVVTQPYVMFCIWCGFDRASSLICGNKMAARCDRWFLLQVSLFAQHVSGTTMPIIRSSRVLYRWLLLVVFGALVSKLSVWCGAEGYVSGLRAAVASSWHFTSTSYLYNKFPNFLCFVDPAALYNLANKTNLVHNLFLVYLSISTGFGRLCAHHQEKQLFLCDTWYLLFCVDECLLCRVEFIPPCVPIVTKTKFFLLMMNP